MNIFVTDECPVKSAEALDDKRLVKMVLETAQILSAVARASGCDSPNLYKTTHANHPCVLWAQECAENWSWLLGHGFSLATEYRLRYGRKHAATDVICEVYCFAEDSITDNQPAAFVNCTPHKDMDVIAAYRLTFNEKWLVDKRPPKWTNRTPPAWRIA